MPRKPEIISSITPDMFSDVARRKADLINTAEDGLISYVVQAANRYPLLNRGLEQVIFRHFEDEKKIRNRQKRRENVGDYALTAPKRELKQDKEFWAAVPEGQERDFQVLLSESTNIKQVLVNANLGLVVSIAKKIKGLPLTDLIQEGVIGLMKAIDKFEYERGNKLSTYADMWIFESMQRAVADTSRTIRVPVHTGEYTARIKRIVDQYYVEHGEGADPETLYCLVSERYPNLSRETFDSFITTLTRGILHEPLSLNMPSGAEDSNEEFGDTIPDNDHPFESKQSRSRQQKIREKVQEAVATLSLREQLTLKMRYREGATLEEVGQELGVTRERVRQIQQTAIRHLRSILVY